MANDVAVLRVGLVGYGYWGRNHARVFGELEGSRVVVICDEHPERLEEAGRKHADARLTTSLDDVLGAPDVDAIVVCTPASTHSDVTRRCLMAGKHVLVEKPFTTNVLDAETLTDLAAERGLTLMVGQTFLFNQGVLKLHEVIQSGEIGRVHYMYARRTNLGPIRHDVSALWDLAPHDVSIFNRLTESVPLWVSAVASRVLRRHLEDVGFITLAYPGNVLAHIHVSWSDPSKVREIVIVGSQERVVFNDVDTAEQVRIFEKGVEAVPDADVPYRTDSFGEFRLLVRDGDIRSPRLPAEEPLQRECLHFLDCVRTGSPPVSGGREGTDVVRVMEAIHASVALRGAPVELAPAGAEAARAIA
jgi:predicted dehydrogenase